MVNFSAIISNNQLSIRASLTSSIDFESEKESFSIPIQSIKLFSKKNYRIKLIGLDEEKNIILNKEYDSDNYGNFEIKRSAISQKKKIQNIIAYETSQIPGVDFHMGSFLPLQINNPVKILISDFDKTLVDTKYSTPKEMYYSLNRPLNYFPPITKTIEHIKELIDKGFQPFILSASPHFYERAIRDWLYQNQIFASNIYLKDYRDFISLFDGRLTTKDLKIHGFYKLNKLIDILLMTGIPDELVLFGDGFESDPFIYLTLSELLDPKVDPWKLWKSIKNHSFFNLTSKQDSSFITKFYQLNQMSKNKGEFKLDIYIRTISDEIDSLKNKVYENKSLNSKNERVHYYLSEREK